MLKNYIFDLGGVLLDIRMQNSYERFTDFGLPAAELAVGADVYKLMENYQLGWISSDDFCKQIAERCHLGTTPYQIECAWNSICLGVAERKLEALRRLRQTEGVASVSLLSNTNTLHWDCCCKNWFSANGNKPEDLFRPHFLESRNALAKAGPRDFQYGHPRARSLPRRNDIPRR